MAQAHLAQVEDAAVLALQLSLIQACQQEQGLHHMRVPFSSSSTRSRYTDRQGCLRSRSYAHRHTNSAACCSRSSPSGCTWWATQLLTITARITPNSSSAGAGRRLMSREFSSGFQMHGAQMHAAHTQPARLPFTQPKLTYAACALHNNHDQADAGTEGGPQHGCGPDHSIHARLQIQRAGQHLQQQQGEQRAKGAANQDAGPAEESSRVAEVLGGHGMGWRGKGSSHCSSRRQGQPTARGVQQPARETQHSIQPRGSHEQASGHDES